MTHSAQERVATPTGSDDGTQGVLNSFLSEKTRKSKAQCKRTQHSWPSSPNIVGCYMLRPFAYTVAYCWELLHCAKFETSQTFSHVQMHETTPNIVGPTMLGVVASVCTQLNRLQMSLQRQQFLLSYLMTLNVSPAGVLTRDLPPSRRTLSQLT